MPTSLLKISITISFENIIKAFFFLLPFLGKNIV